VNVFGSINRAEINENDGMMTVSHDGPQFFKRQRVLGSSGESKLSRRMDRHQGISPIRRRAVALLAQFTFWDLNSETAQDHAQTSRDTGIRGFLVVKRRLRWHRGFLRKADERRLSFPLAECVR